MEASRTYMKKADKELKSAEKSEMGYLQLEREWFEQTEGEGILRWVRYPLFLCRLMPFHKKSGASKIR